MDNYAIVVDPADLTGFRRLQPSETLVLEKAGPSLAGRIVRAVTPETVTFRDAEGRIRPVAPFLEVWARLRKMAR